MHCAPTTLMLRNEFVLNTVLSLYYDCETLLGLSVRVRWFSFECLPDIYLLVFIFSKWNVYLLCTGNKCSYTLNSVMKTCASMKISTSWLLLQSLREKKKPKQNKRSQPPSFLLLILKLPGASQVKPSQPFKNHWLTCIRQESSLTFGHTMQLTAKVCQ